MEVGVLRRDIRPDGERVLYMTYNPGCNKYDYYAESTKLNTPYRGLSHGDRVVIPGLQGAWTVYLHAEQRRCCHG